MDVLHSHRMIILTIPKKLAQKGELALVPRREYEEFLKFRAIKTFRMTPTQKRVLAKARRDFAKGRYLTLEQLKREMDSRRTS